MPRPVLNLTVGPTQYSGAVYSANVLEQEYGIDAAVIVIPRLNATASLFGKGTPIQFVYGRTPSQFTTYTGYVHHVEPSQSMGESTSRVVCMGAASPVLRDTARRVWPVDSDSSVAVDSIANALHLSSLTEFANITAPGGPVNESWWRYLVRASKQCGFTCYTVATDLRFHSRRIDASGDAVPWFQNYDTPIVQFYNTVHSFRVVDSDDEADYSPHRARRVFGVSDEGLYIEFEDSDDLASVGGITQTLPALTRTENIVVHDVGTAQNRLTATQERNRFTKVSEFVLSGDERVRQGSTIVIRGISATLDGYWYVMKVQHQLATDAYSMTVTAGRDGIGDNAPVNLQATNTPIIDVGRREPVQAPLPQLVKQNVTLASTVFPDVTAAWTASAATNRQHFPWRATVRG